MNARTTDVDAFANMPSLDLKTDALLFDVDGTLLNIAPRPEDVHVPAALRGTLAELALQSGGAVALVSGRTLGVLDSLFAPLRLPTIACHGAEMRRLPKGPCEELAPPLPESIRNIVADLAKFDSRIVVEDKSFTLAFHYRAAMDREDAFLCIAREHLSRLEPGFTMLFGKAIVEVKSNAFDKGSALRKFLGTSPFKGRRPVFCGDDTTDESAFAVLPEFEGIGISVGREMAGAAFTVSEPRDMRRWLATVAARNGDA